MTGVHRAVVAAQDDSGAVFYEYGWAREVSMVMDAELVTDGLGRRLRTHERHRTTIEWVRPPRRSATYPTDADFERPAEIDAAQRALAGAQRELAP